MEILNIKKSDNIYLVDYANNKGNKYARISESQLINFIDMMGFDEAIDPDSGEYYIQEPMTTIDVHGLTELLTSYIEYRDNGYTFDTIITNRKGERVFIEVFYRISGFKIYGVMLSDDDQYKLGFNQFYPAQICEIYAQIFEHQAQVLAQKVN